MHSIISTSITASGAFGAHEFIDSNLHLVFLENAECGGDVISLYVKLTRVEA
jgi:hypothetical protein